MSEQFEPGNGVPVGKILIVQGKAVIIHEDKKMGFPARAELSIYQGDMIVTLDSGRVRLALNDGSLLTLASETKLVISRSVFDSANKERSSFVNMFLGKARYWIRKFSAFNRSDFKVKTKTAVVGVRGSDFIVRARESVTEVTALRKTSLEIFSLVAPCAKAADDCILKPVILTDFERTRIDMDGIIADIETIVPEDIEKLIDEFRFGVEREDREAFQEPMEPKTINNIFVSERDLIRPTGQIEDTEPSEIPEKTKEDETDQTDEGNIAPEPAPIIDPPKNSLPDFPKAPPNTP